MVARLLLDAIWRNRWAYVVVAIFLTSTWLIYIAGGSRLFDFISLPALSLIFAAATGPMVAINAMGMRELRHLPVTNRDLWRTSWILATVVSSGGLLATKMLSALLVLAFGGSPKVSAETMLLSAVYDFSWAGTVLLVVPSLGRSGPPALTLLGYSEHASAFRRALTLSLTVGGIMLALLACFVLPILVEGELPTAMGDFTPAAIGVLIACLAIAFGGLAWTPHRAPAAWQPTRFQPPAPIPATSSGPRLADRVTGIARVFVPHMLTTIALPIGACLALAVYGVVFGNGLWWFVPPTPAVFDPEDTGYRGLTYFVLMPSFIVTVQSLWMPWTRLLKVLPLSVRQINALLLLTPFATWTVLWLLGWIGYSLAYGTPETLRIEFALGMAALAALVQAILLRFQGSTGFGWIIGAFGGLMPQFAKVALSNSIGGQVLFAVICISAVCFAAFVNHRTLTRSTSGSRPYQRPQARFGMTAKPGLG